MMQIILDPQLESLRNTSEDITTDLTNHVEVWLEKGKNYTLQRMSGTQVGWEVFHTIAKFIDGTIVGLKGDWKHLAAILGLNILDINRIENFSCSKGVTLDILSQIALKPTGTVSQLIQALNSMERFDILLELSSKLNELLIQPDSCNASPTIVSLNPIKEIYPESIPHKETLLHLSSQVAAHKTKKSTVLLTFAQDGFLHATDIARRFRNTTPTIRVVILEENAEELMISPDSIFRWYKEVDYIIPLITKQYLNQIVPRDGDLLEVSCCLDSRYSRLIYVMMNEEFIQNKCRNLRVRPINFYRKKHSLFVNPLFFMCKNPDDMEKLAASINNSNRVQK